MFRIAVLLLLIASCADASQRQLGARSLAQAALKHQKSNSNVQSLDPAPYVYNVRYFEQTLDHFNFEPTVPATYQQKYLINDTWWQKPDASKGIAAGPIFFYTGNEGPITLFAQNTGFMWDIAPAYNALLIFAEHRYYGDSMPYGNQTFSDPKNLRFLTMPQALADFARLLSVVKTDLNAVQAPVIAFGGSYGGMLSSWFRMKYPHIVAGAIASSAPIWQFTGITGPEVYNQIVTGDFQVISSCASNIRNSWDMMTTLSQTADGLAFLSSTFHTCSPFASADHIMNDLFPYIVNAYGYMAMVDYPYPTSFLGPMPAYPVTEACGKFLGVSSTDPRAVITAVYQAVNVFYNYSGQQGPCVNVSSNEPTTLADAGGWNYQSCTEMVMPIGQYGGKDMFYPAPWNLTSIIQGCQQSFGVTPRPYWIEEYLGGKNIQDFTNIVFTNGDLDPWSGGGVLAQLAATLPSIYIKGGAHHLDLRSSNPADPQSVIDARQQIRGWIDKFIATGDSTSDPCKGMVNRSTVGASLVLVAAISGLGTFALVYILFVRRRPVGGQGSAFIDQRGDGPYAQFDAVLPPRAYVASRAPAREPGTYADLSGAASERASLNPQA